ncbi:hypothetical protein [Dokdonella sp.]|uniref:hypothetical protein n=1 Tax=Dokdonella sp. TaxID=2291710 RepID=UPI001B16F228|nr:hypothetical protein [Dokdonella sp.]MBO9664721.1 hypothetical protein [Dokdonella sp.]
MRPISSLALILLIAVSAVAAQTQSPTLEERMSQADFRAAGLDKLSPEELQRLNAWLQSHGGTQTKYVTASGAPVFYPDMNNRDVIETRIAGLFTGWRGKTVFKFDNGQEWQQTESGAFSAGEFNNPAVKIKPMILGSWLMVVDGCNCSVRVQRIK